MECDTHQLPDPTTVTLCFFAAPSVAYTDGTITYQGQVDTVNGITVGFVFPPVTDTATPPEFIAQIKATSNTVKWIGVALGGAMANNPLLVAWPSGPNVTAVSRSST